MCCADPSADQPSINPHFFPSRLSLDRLPFAHFTATSSWLLVCLGGNDLDSQLFKVKDLSLVLLFVCQTHPFTYLRHLAIYFIDLPPTELCNMSDLEDFIETWVGGGGQAASSPHPALTPTRLLHTAIKATECDSGLISKAQIRRTQQNTPTISITENPGPNDNPSFTSPKVQCASELFQSTDNTVLDYLCIPPRHSPVDSSIVCCSYSSSLLSHFMC